MFSIACHTVVEVVSLTDATAKNGLVERAKRRAEVVEIFSVVECHLREESKRQTSIGD